MKKTLILISILIVAMALPVAAGTNTWTGAVNNLWSEPNNWNLFRVPTSGDPFYMGNTTGAGVDLDVDGWGGSGRASRMGVGVDTVSRLYSDAHTLTITEGFRGAQDLGSEAHITLSGTAGLDCSGGVLSIGYSGAGYLNLSDDATFASQRAAHVANAATSTGLVNQTGGTFSVYGTLDTQYLAIGIYGGVGQYNLHGGLLTVAVAGVQIGATSNLDITTGTMQLGHWDSGDPNNANWVSEINTMYGDGRITAYGGSGVLQVTTDELYTYVSAIPEPATLAILGAGAMLLRRRRRMLQVRAERCRSQL